MSLDEMEKVVPWFALEALVRPHYAKVGNGRQPVGLSGRTASVGRKQGRKTIQPQLTTSSASATKLTKCAPTARYPHKSEAYAEVP